MIDSLVVQQPAGARRPVAGHVGPRAERPKQLEAAFQIRNRRVFVVDVVAAGDEISADGNRLLREMEDGVAGRVARA